METAIFFQNLYTIFVAKALIFYPV